MYNLLIEAFAGKCETLQARNWSWWIIYCVSRLETWSQRLHRHKEGRDHQRQGQNNIHMKCTVSPPGSIALSSNNNCLVSSRSHVPGSATYKSQQGYPTITSNNPTRGSYNNNQLTYRTEVTVRGGHSWQAGNNSLTLCVTPQTDTIAVFFTYRAMS